MRRLTIACDRGIAVDDLPNGRHPLAASTDTGTDLGGPFQSLADATVRFQSEYIHNVIQAEGNMSSAARRLGLHRSNLYRKMRQLGMEPPESAAGCASECDEATDIA